MRTPFAVLMVCGSLALSGCARDTGYSLGQVSQFGDTAYTGAQYDEALRWYTEYLDRKPGDPEVRAQRGRTLLKLGRGYDAAAELRIAYSQRPDRPAYLDSLAEALLAANERDELFRLLRTNAQDRGGVDDYLRLGRFSAAMGDSDTARTALNTAARIDRGQSIQPQLALAQFHHDTGDKDAAARRVRMAYYLSPESAEVKTMARQFGLTPYPGWGLVPTEAPSR